MNKNKNYTIRKISNHFFEELDLDKKKYSQRLYERYLPDEAIWWIIPSKEWPAYKHGKIVFKKDNNKDNIFIGLHIEKGYSHKGLQGEIEKSMLMSGDWFWYHFLKNICKNKEISDNSNIELSFEVINEPKNQFISYLNKNDNFSKIDNNTYFPDIYQKFSQIKNLKELIKHIEMDDNLNFYWINFLIGKLYKRKEVLNHKEEEEEVISYLTLLKSFID
jgi:hypothetical protein